MRAMGTVIIKIPLVTWRAGRPRYIPGAAHRALGFVGEDLRHGPGGPWYTLDEAIAWSQARQAEAEARRRRQPVRKPGRRPATAAAGFTTVGQVLTHFLERNPAMLGVEQLAGKRRRKALAPNTVRFYRASARVLEQFDGGHVWLSPAAQLTGRALDGILAKIEEGRGLAQARAVRALVSVAFRWGRGQRLVAHDPLATSEEPLPVPAPRVRAASVLEIATLVATADALGWPEIGDAVLLGVFTAQRQADRIALEAAAIGPDGILFTPAKKNHGAATERLLLPWAKPVADRWQAARGRRAAWPEKPATLLAEERGRAPWQADWYRKVFRVVRDVAATGRRPAGAGGKVPLEVASVLGKLDVPAALAAAGVTPMPSLADLRDQDLRDTALSWLALAGADKWEIAGFSGHAFGKAEAVLRHYVAVPPQFARSGMAKLEAWHATQLAALEAAAAEARA